MKKIMILMLSLAVLFSFAACDNSSNTPEPTPEPGESTGTVPYGTVKTIGSGISSLVDELFTAGFAADSDIVETSGTVTSVSDATAPTGMTGAEAKYVVEDANTYTTVSYVVTYKGITPTEDASYTLTIYGEDAEDYDANDTTRVVNLSSYDLEFSTPDSNADEYTRIAGTVSGFVTGTLDVTIDNAGKVTALSVGSEELAVYLPETAAKVTGIKYGTLDVDADDLLANVNEGADASASPYAYDKVVETNTETAEGAIKAWVSLLTGANSGATSLSGLMTGMTDEDSQVKGTYDQENATATITYTAAAQAPLMIASDAATATKSIWVPAGQSLTVVLTGKDATATGMKVTDFSIANATLDVRGADNATMVTPSEGFDRITIANLAGEITAGTVTCANGYVSAVGTALTFATTPEAGTASATVEGIKPELNAADVAVIVNYAD